MLLIISKNFVETIGRFEKSPNLAQGSIRVITLTDLEFWRSLGKLIFRGALNSLPERIL
jgi:hypothetical protein